MGSMLRPAAAPTVFVLLLLMLLGAEARPLPVLALDKHYDHQQGYSEEQRFSGLGLVCKCCDHGGADSEGGKDDCTTSWTGSCSNLQCLPWKSHH